MALYKAGRSYNLKCSNINLACDHCKFITESKGNLKKHEVETSNCYNSVDCSPRIDFITILKSGRCAEFIAVIILYCIALYCTAFLLQRPEWHQVSWLPIFVGFCCVHCMCYMHCINCVVLYCTYFTVLYCISSSNVSTPVQNKHPHPHPFIHFRGLVWPV